MTADVLNFERVEDYGPGAEPGGVSWYVDAGTHRIGRVAKRKDLWFWVCKRGHTDPSPDLRGYQTRQGAAEALHSHALMLRETYIR